MNAPVPLHRTLESELYALLRGASLECLVCGEFVLHRGRVLECPECGMTVMRELPAAASGAETEAQTG